MRLKGQVCIITGGGSGIGRGAALAMAQEGATVVINGRTESKLVSVKAEVEAAGGTAVSYAFDVADYDAVEQMTADVLDKFGRIDVLVNNAGHSSQHRRLLNTPPEEMRSVIDSNLMGTFFCTKAVVPAMLKAKSGTIINISSLAAVTPGPFSGFAYGAAKLWWRHPAPSRPVKLEFKVLFSNVLHGLQTVLRHLGMVAASVTEASKMMANGALMAFLPLYALSVGLSLAESGVLFGMQGLTSFLSKPVMGRVSDRVGRRPLITLGLLVCGLSIMAVPQATQMAWLALCAAGFGFGEAIITSSSAAMIADLGKAENVGAGMGLRGTIMDIGHASGPIVAGVLVAAISYTGAFTIIGCLQLLTATGFWIVTRRRSERL